MTISYPQKANNYFISFALPKDKKEKKTKQNKHYDQYVDVGRDITTAKEPITAGPEIKYM